MDSNPVAVTYNSELFRRNPNLCKIQLDFYPFDKVVSSVTKVIYDCVTPAWIIYLNFYAPSVTYSITCCRCSLQYVGENLQKLNEKLKIGFKHPSKHWHYKIFCVYFAVLNTGSHILKKIEDNGKTKMEVMDPFFAQKSKAKETKWIKTLM